MDVKSMSEWGEGWSIGPLVSTSSLWWTVVSLPVGPGIWYPIFNHHSSVSSPIVSLYVASCPYGSVSQVSGFSVSSRLAPVRGFFNSSPIRHPVIAFRSPIYGSISSLHYGLQSPVAHLKFPNSDSCLLIFGRLFILGIMARHSQVSLWSHLSATPVPVAKNQIKKILAIDTLA